MGTVVLDPGIRKDQSVRIYAHCSTNGRGGVALVALNTDAEHEQALSVPIQAEAFALTAPDLTSTNVMLNGVGLEQNQTAPSELLRLRRLRRARFGLLPPA
jgi:hypothetical protein